MSDTMFDAMFGAAIAGGAQGGGFTPTEQQLTAMNSGITSTDVEQITTNKTNILLSEQMNGAKNIVNIQDEYFNIGTTKINGDNGTITLEINNTAWTTYRTAFVTQAVDYKLIFYVDSLTKNVQFFVQRMSDSHNYIGGEIKGTGISIFDFTSTGGNALLSLNLDNEGIPTTANITFRCMIIPKSIYDAGFTDYQPYALSNVDLTANISLLYGKLQEKNIASQYAGATSNTYTYTINKDDFGNRGIGIYIIYICNWSTIPNVSIYAVAYSGGVITQSTLAKIAGVDVNISLSNGVISYTGDGYFAISAII